MEIELFDDRMGRLYDAGLQGVWLVNPAHVRLEDLEDIRPHAIIRVRDIHNAIKFLPSETCGLEGCIAGWVSDEEVSSKTDTSGASNG